jgi:hypothetical protein
MCSARAGQKVRVKTQIFPFNSKSVSNFVGGIFLIGANREVSNGRYMS